MDISESQMKIVVKVILHSFREDTAQVALLSFDAELTCRDNLTYRGPFQPQLLPDIAICPLIQLLKLYA